MIRKKNWVTNLLLSIVTLGIYNLIEFYEYANDVNTVCEGDGKTTIGYIPAMLLSLVTCGIYLFIWTYGIGARLEQAGKRYGVKCHPPLIYLLTYLVPIYNQYYITTNMNEFADKINVTVE